MELDPNERDAWVSDAQRWICQIKGVLQCKIDIDTAGEITGVHVVAGMDREPRHVVRDVESLLKARLQLDVFYKKIGVVQVMDNSSADLAQAEILASGGPVAGIPGPSGVTFHPSGSAAADDSRDPVIGPGPVAAEELPSDPDPSPATVPPPLAAPIPAVLVAEGLTSRVVCSGVSVMASDMIVRAEVQLRSGDLEAQGTREGPNHAGSDLQLVGRAALAALAEMLVDPVLLHLNEIRIADLGGQSIVMTAVDLVEGRISDTLFGTCSTRHNLQQAVVHAVLDALNRRLSLYSLKPLAAED